MNQKNRVDLYIPGGLRGSEKAQWSIELILRLEQQDLRPLLLYDFDNVDASVLPHFVRQYSLEEFVDWTAFGESGVRELLKIAGELHRYKGTKWAVDRTLSLVNARIELIEWWQLTPRGVPYTARVVLWGDDNENAALDFSDADVILRLNRLLKASAPAARRLELNVGYRVGADPESEQASGAFGVFGITTPLPVAEIPATPYNVVPIAAVKSSGVVSSVPVAEVPGSPRDAAPTGVIGAVAAVVAIPVVEV
ncbi:MAG: phage tail protein I [Cyanobacteria bacterium SBC]|nr:phage tail protein I [Cyanobacteria bacterium SBC]